MRLAPVFALCATAVIGCTPHVGGVPERLAPKSDSAVFAADSASGVQMPAQIRKFRLVGAEVIGGAAEGGLYRFSDGSRTRVTVFVYPVGADVAGEPTPGARVLAEGGKYPMTLPIGVERGWFDDYHLAFSDADSAVAEGIVLPGHAVGVVTKRRDTIEVELQYLFLVRERFVKVRATVPERGWQQTEVPNFARELALVLAVP